MYVTKRVVLFWYHVNVNEIFRTIYNLIVIFDALFGPKGLSHQLIIRLLEID